MMIEVEANHFSGRGSAWFDLIELEKSLAAFEEYPIKPGGAPVIAGGDWNDDASKLLKEHVHVSVKPLGPLGELVMTVSAFRPIRDYEVQGMGFGVCVDLLIDYSQLGEFVKGMRALIAGSLSIVRIEIGDCFSGRIG